MSNYHTLQYQDKYNLEVLNKKIQGLRTGKRDNGLGDSRRGVEVQSEEVSLQAAAENGQGRSSSYGDGKIVPPLGSEGGEAPQSGRARASCTAGRMGKAACGSRAEWWSWCVGLNYVL